MSNADTRVEHARMMAAARWGDQVLRRSAAEVLARAVLSDGTRSELETIAGVPAEGDDAV